MPMPTPLVTRHTQCLHGSSTDLVLRLCELMPASHLNAEWLCSLQALDLQRSISARHLSLGSRPSQDSLQAAEGARRTRLSCSSVCWHICLQGRVRDGAS
jgi:hypothetical protein